MIIDSHAHYDDEAFEEDRDVLLTGLYSHGVEKVINVGASMETSKTTLALAEKYDFIYAAIGVHPSSTADLTESDMEWLKEQALKNRKVVAIGEIGLDYFYDDPDREIQKKWFERQLVLAKEVNLPISIHSREACEDTLDIMRAVKANEIGGVVHCYSYSKETARDYLNMGYYFGIGGVVTFKNAKKVKEAVEYIPMDRIVLETDCPYLTPEPNRGKRNSSMNIPDTARVIAAIKGISYEEVVETATKNTIELFHI